MIKNLATTSETVFLNISFAFWGHRVAIIAPFYFAGFKSHVNLIHSRFSFAVQVRPLTRDVGHKSLMTLSILFMTSLLMASSSGRGDMNLKKSSISSCSLRRNKDYEEHEASSFADHRCSRNQLKSNRTESKGGQDVCDCLLHSSSDDNLT